PLLSFSFQLSPQPPRPPLFPYTTLFRSAPEKGDRVLAVTDVDLFDHGLNFVFGHATIRDRFAVVSIARFGSDGPEKLLERSAKTDRKSTRLNSSHDQISYAVFCLKKKTH